jgi:hypothetical protein
MGPDLKLGTPRFPNIEDGQRVVVAERFPCPEPGASWGAQNSRAAGTATRRGHMHGRHFGSMGRPTGKVDALPTIAISHDEEQLDSCGPVLSCSGWAKLWLAVYRFGPADASEAH